MSYSLEMYVLTALIPLSENPFSRTCFHSMRSITYNLYWASQCGERGPKFVHSPLHVNNTLEFYLSWFKRIKKHVLCWKLTEKNKFRYITIYHQGVMCPPCLFCLFFSFMLQSQKGTLKDFSTSCNVSNACVILFNRGFFFK